MTPLLDYLLLHAVRGPCLCVKCASPGLYPDHRPATHYADLIFFQVRRTNDPNADKLRALIREHKGEFCDADPFDGLEHNYLELGAWIGDQGAALTLMGLGSLLGLWTLRTPRTMLGKLLSEAEARHMAGMGAITIEARSDHVCRNATKD